MFRDIILMITTYPLTPSLTREGDKKGEGMEIALVAAIFRRNKTE